MTKSSLIQAQNDFLRTYAEKCSLALTLQTSLKTFNLGEKRMGEMARAAEMGMLKFLPRLNQLLTGNGFRRDNAKLPIIISSLEGTINNYDSNKTLHFHLAIGNFDKARVERADFKEALTAQWIAAGIGTADIDIKAITKGTEARWIDYIGKEAWRGNMDCINYETTQIPTNLLGS